MSEEKVLEDEQQQNPVESGDEAPADCGNPAPGDSGEQIPVDGNENEDSGNSKLAEEIENLKDENEKLKDQYLRKAADFENYRKRVIKEKQEAIDYANSNILLDIPIVRPDKRIAEIPRIFHKQVIVNVEADGTQVFNKKDSSRACVSFGKGVDLPNT